MLIVPGFYLRYPPLYLLILLTTCLTHVSDRSVLAQELNGAESRTADSRQLVQWIIESHADIIDARLGVEVSQFNVMAEQGLYEPVWFNSVSREHTERQRNQSEMFNLFGGSSATEQKEDFTRGEIGVRLPLSTGAEASISYQVVHLDSSLYPDNEEYTARLNIRLTQPLWRGYGRSFVEAGKRIAELDEKAWRLQFHRQLLNVAVDAAQLYWQLYRAYEVRNIRTAALENARQLLADLHSRVNHGQAARSSLLEAQASLADREAELARAEQLLTEVMTHIRISLNMSDSQDKLDLRPVQVPDFLRQDLDLPSERMTNALARLPEYQQLMVRKEQEQERLDYARHLTRPKADLVLGYGFNSLDDRFGRALETSFNRDHEDWSVGLVLEMPLGGNIRARGEAQAQRVRLSQVENRRHALRNRVASDINGRWEQLQRAYREVEEVQQSVGLHEELLDIERQLFDRGRTRLRDVIEREIQLNITRQRFIETAARVEIAKIMLEAADGSLLESYSVYVE